jgi:hypothetical protein
MTLAVCVAALLIVAMALLLYMHWTGPEPGRHENVHPRVQVPVQRGEHPYPPLTRFPDPEPYARVNPSAKRLATTGELRAFAYAGDLEAVNSEVAAFRALVQLEEWTS